MTAKACAIEGCKRPHKASGYCRLHWDRWRRTGDPEMVKARPSRMRVVGATTWIRCPRHPNGEDGEPGAWLPADAFTPDPRQPVPYRALCRACEKADHQARDVGWTPRKRELQYARLAPQREKARERVAITRAENAYVQELCEMVLCADDWLGSRGLARPERAAAIAVTEEAYRDAIATASLGTATHNPVVDRMLKVPLISSDLPRAKKQANGAKWVPVLRARLAQLEAA